MQAVNTEDEYGYVARFFHWSIAVMILGLLPLGLFMSGMENSPVKFQVFGLHKSFGLLVFFLGLARLAWRFISPPPEREPNHARWEHVLASATHFWLYVCIIGMPLSGWLMSSAGNFPVPFFGIQMPWLIGEDKILASLFNEVHEILAYTLLFMLALHVAGALKHHLIDRDETLERMAGHKWTKVYPVILILAAGLSYTACAVMIGKEITGERSEEETTSSAAASSATETDVAPDLGKLPPHGWAIVPAISKLQFRTMVYNAPVMGDFRNFSGTIIFDPADLDNAKVDIAVNMQNVTTGDDNRDSNIASSQWFDVEKFPVSRFVATKFEKADGNKYVAIGELTVHGVTMPLILPFTLDIKDKTAHVVGEVTLDRSHFGVGSGEWADGQTVARDVTVLVDIKAAQ